MNKLIGAILGKFVWVLIVSFIFKLIWNQTIIEVLRMVDKINYGQSISLILMCIIIGSVCTNSKGKK